MDNNQQQNSFTLNGILEGDYLNGKALYHFYYKTIPSIFYLGQIDGEKAFTMLKEKFPALIQRVHMNRWYDHARKRCDFDETFVLLTNLLLPILS
jgi:hypothetical protein